MVHVIEDITPSMEYISINECEKWNSDLIAENILNESNIAYNIDEIVKKQKNILKSWINYRR